MAVSAGRPRAEPRLAWAYVPQANAGAARTPSIDAARRIFRVRDDALHAGGGDPFVLVPVTEYAGLPRGGRPAAFCPVCLERVYLHLGTRLRHHYAHKPESECAAARGEGALHLAAKVHLAAQLAAGGRGLSLRPVCARVPRERGTERCANPPILAWDVAWDEARVEMAVPAARADIMLLRRGAEVAAIEIHAHHEVDADKAEKYRRLGLPWIEVPAHGVITETGIGWTADQPLAMLQDSRHPERWRCPRHEALYRGLLEHERAGVHRLAGRIVHLYRTDGGRSAGEVRARATAVYMMERREDGRLAEAWLERDDTEGRIGFGVRTADREEARRTLHGQFAAWVRWMRDTQSAVVDSPMRWVAPRALEGWKKSAAYSQRLRWDAHQGAFTAAPNLPSASWPRLPRIDALSADPVLGYDGCAWTRLHPEKPPLMHCIAGAVWTTLRVHAGTTPDGEPFGTGHLAAWVHTGERWIPCEGAPYVVTLTAAPDLDPPWTDVLTGWARRLAPHDAATLTDGRIAVHALGEQVSHLPAGVQCVYGPRGT